MFAVLSHSRTDLCKQKDRREAVSPISCLIRRPLLVPSGAAAPRAAEWQPERRLSRRVSYAVSSKPIRQGRWRRLDTGEPHLSATRFATRKAHRPRLPDYLIRSHAAPPTSCFCLSLMRLKPMPPGKSYQCWSNAQRSHFHPEFASDNRHDLI